MKQYFTFANFMKNQKGYMALTSVIIMFAILVALVLTLSLSGFFNRSNVLDVYSKEKSLALAEGCAEEALLRLADDLNYAGGETIAISEGFNCEIMPVLLFGDYREVRTSAEVGEAITMILVRVDKDDLTLVSWEELDEF